MKISFKIVALLLLAALCLGFNPPSARAFSLLGPFEPWMVASNSFNPGDDAQIGGPMCISNGYRWNVPVVTYGFDASFVNYFGTNGEAAVVSAINLLNSLPPASQMSPTNFPLDITHENYSAQAQAMLDLKTETLFLLLEHLGLASPGSGIECMKSYSITGETITADVLLRNYDPLTYQPSDYINGTLFFYLVGSSVPRVSDRVYISISSPGLAMSIPSSVAEGLSSISTGTYFTGVTADDVGGLCYLYSTNNVNYETLLPDVSGVGGATIVNGAWRPGVDKVTFVPQSVDASGNFLPTTNQYTDTFISNGVMQSQMVQRVTTQPDFVFSATNLPINPGSLFSRTDTGNWANNAALNGHPGGSGPGIIVPSVKFVFTQFGTEWDSENGVMDDSGPFSTSQWGTFDGTTNAPILYQSQMSTNQSTMTMLMYLNDSVNGQPYTWQMSGPAGDLYNFQSSTDLVNWMTLFTVTNNGTANALLNYSPPGPQQFYRITPQAN